MFCVITSSVYSQEGSDTVPQLQKRLQDDPEDIEALLKLALQYGIEKKYLKAVETYFAVIKIDPKNYHAYNNLGILYKKTGQFKDSLYCYQQARKLNPEAYSVCYNMGLAYEAMGRMQEAREAYGKALSINPDCSEALQRLRDLSDDPLKVPVLPKPPKTKVIMVDAGDAKPRQIPIAEKPGKVPAEAPAPVPEKPATPPSEKKPPAKPSETSPEKPAPKSDEQIVRTIRSGPAASLFNQAMDVFEKDDLKKALELYTRAILADRDLLGEPDNGLIQKALDLLKDRPNCMNDGFFYRGFFVSISQNLEKAIPDFNIYLEQNAKGLFVAEAREFIDRHEREVAAAEALKAKKASETYILLPPPEPAPGSFVPRIDDYSAKKLPIDDIIEEANKLSREERITEAIAVLRNGMEREPENLRLLMTIGNAYTDLMLLKGDNAAGKMAKEIFERVARIAPESKEATMAQNMIKELSARVQ